MLRAQDYGESDRIVTLLTRDAGKLSGIAKGAKRSQRRFAGALGLFSNVQLEYRHRLGADLAFLERATLLRPWRSMVASLERYAAASHVVELADKMTVEQEIGDELYAVVLAALARLDAAEPGPATLRLFELAVLSACGYRAELIACVSCRRTLREESGPVRVAPTAGGVVCSRCVPIDATAATLSPRSLACLAAMQETLGGRGSRSPGDRAWIFSADAEIGSRMGVVETREVAVAVAALISPHLRGRLRAIELLGPILLPR